MILMVVLQCLMNKNNLAMKKTQKITIILGFNSLFRQINFFLHFSLKQAANKRQIRPISAHYVTILRQKLHYHLCVLINDAIKKHLFVSGWKNPESWL